MKVKLMMHLMPWELDNALLTFVKLKKSFEYLNQDIEIVFDCVMNLSSAIIDWDKSEFDKKYFIEKFNTIKGFIECFTVNRYDVVETDQLYGHLNLQKEAISDDVDGYIYICSDFNFDETTLSYICNAAKNINDEYFILTTEIYKAWDSSWDIISSKKYANIPHEKWHEECPFKIELNNFDNDVYVEQINQFKFAGWFDFYSKNFINKFATIPESWVGYGPWDLYSMILSYSFNSRSIDKKINQYVLRGKIIKGINNKYLENGISEYYRNRLKVKMDAKIQRKNIESKINNLVDETISKFISD